jgi:hypothetical protein
LEGFSKWRTQRKLPVEKTVEEFKKTRKKYDSYYNSDGLVDGMDKIKSTKEFDQNFSG